MRRLAGGVGLTTRCAIIGWLAASGNVVTMADSGRGGAGGPGLWIGLRRTTHDGMERYDWHDWPPLSVRGWSRSLSHIFIPSYSFVCSSSCADVAIHYTWLKLGLKSWWSYIQVRVPESHRDFS